MTKKIILLLFICLNNTCYCQFYLPIHVYNRFDVNNVELTQIGSFGEIRKPRPNIPKHLHTGIDIKRPNKNYQNEPIFPIYDGIVISVRDDGAFAQIIIEHEFEGTAFWSVYEHIAGIKIGLGDNVNPNKPIARFMNTTELNKYGWQFDHVHLEILKIEPLPLKPSQKLPNRYFTTYWLSCFNVSDLEKYYYDPLKFLGGRIFHD